MFYALSDPTRRYRSIPSVVRHRGIENPETVELMAMLDKDLYLWRETADLEVRFQRIGYVTLPRFLK